MRFRSRRLALLVAAVLLGGGAGVLPSPSAAQEILPRAQGLLDFLFRPPLRRGDPGYPGGPGRRTDDRPARNYVDPEPEQVRPRRAARTPVPAVPREPEIEIVEKRPDAKTILIVGDFLAGGLAEGLTIAYAEEAGLRVVDRSKGSSGLVRDDFYDWPAEIAAILEAEKPDLVAIMIGSNDRQQMVVGGKREDKRTQPWTDAYEDRASALAAALETYGKPFVWVGVPSFKSPSMSSDMLAFNDVYRQAVEAAGGQFVDIWDGFVDENGAFVATGPDINGQPARLRAGDGINLTRAGKRKVAFYAERPIARLFDGRPALARPDGGAVGPGEAAGAAPAMIDRTVPISLAGPELDGGEELLGADVAGRNGKGPAAHPFETGAVPGRADDFRADKVQASPSVPRTQTPAPAPGTDAGPITSVTR